MASYKAFQKRKENASPHASEAICSKCRYGEWVKTRAFCSGFGKPSAIPQKTWAETRPGYCTRYFPKEGRVKQHGRDLDCMVDI